MKDSDDGQIEGRVDAEQDRHRLDGGSAAIGIDVLARIILLPRWSPWCRRAMAARTPCGSVGAARSDAHSRERLLQRDFTGRPDFVSCVSGSVAGFVSFVSCDAASADRPMRLPHCAAQPLYDSPAEKTRDATVSPKATLLIVDDEPDVREVLEEYFTAHGYATIGAENAAAAKALAAEHCHRPGAGRHQHAGRGWLEPRAPSARALRQDRDRHADFRRRRSWIGSWVSRWAPTTTSPSRSTRASSRRA